MLTFLRKNTLTPANLNKRTVRPAARQEGTERGILAREGDLSDLVGNYDGNEQASLPNLLYQKGKKSALSGTR